MRGSSQARRCGVCEKTVHDLAHLTAGKVEVLAMRAAAGDAVCARITRRSDGELMMRQEREIAGRSYAGAVVLSAALTAGLPAAGQTPQGSTLVAEAGPHASAELVRVEEHPAEAIITGRLLKPDGTPVEAGLIYISGSFYVADDRGRFELHAAPGTYDVAVQTGPRQAEHMPSVVLHEGKQSFGDVRTLANQADLLDSYSTTGGVMKSTVRWSWRGRLRHPVLYLRSVARRS